MVEERGGAVAAVHHLNQEDHGDGVFFADAAAHAAARTQRDPGHPPGSDEWRESLLIGSGMGGVTMKSHGFFVHNDALEQQIRAEYIAAGRPKNLAVWLRARLKDSFPSLTRKPRWAGDEGDWPFFEDRPMVFVGQALIRENAVTREALAGGWMVYLFACAEGDRTAIKLLEQSVGMQTAEQHYRAEEMMGEYVQHPHDEAVIRRCVEKGDKYVQEFLLEQPRLSRLGLELLAEKGKNKELRDRAKKRLVGD